MHGFHRIGKLSFDPYDFFGYQFKSSKVFKKWTNPKVFSNFSTIDLLIHAIGCCLLPYPMQTWDEAKGSMTIHKLRKDQVFRELMASIDPFKLCDQHFSP